MKTFKLISIFLITVALIACETSTEVAPETTGQSELNVNQNNGSNNSAISASKSEMHSGLATIRRATAQYHDVKKAIEDGFVPAAPCQENPEGEGGLGIPYVNGDRVDANIDLSEPEVLFYEPQKNGRLRLIGAEPVVPIALWTEEEPPSLFGEEFHRNDDAGLFGLHIWIWKHNPEGVLAFWHSDVSCEFAE